MSFFRKKQEQPRCVALVVAAGQSMRMGGVNKLMQPLDGIPVLVHTLQALEAAQLVDEVVLAVREEEIVPMGRLCRQFGLQKCSKIVSGGKSRTHSVLRAALEAGEADFLAVQDGARPLVRAELIDAVIRTAYTCGAAAPAVAVKDTIKSVDAQNVVESTLERASLRAVQTPQVFESSLLKAALQGALEEGASITDDCSAVERLGKKVYLIDGQERNLKITTPLDLVLAQAILDLEKDAMTDVIGRAVK